MQVIPIRRFSTRGNMVLGGDRELVLLAGLLSFALVVSGQTLVTSVIGVVFWVVSLFLLRLMAKHDPNLRNVYLRHIKYKKYYSARSTPFCVNKREYN